MSNELPDDSTHPANIDDATREAAMAALDNEDTELGESSDEEGDAPADDAGKPEGEQAGEGEGDVQKEGDPAPAAKDPAAPAAEEVADDGKVDKKAFDGVLAELRATREEVKALKQQSAALAAPPEDRDFKAERDALREKWDNGDVDTDAYNEQRDALVIEEAEHRAAVRFHALQQQQAAESANQAWNSKVSAWETANAEFLANPIRKKAVNDLLAVLDGDPNKRLSDDDLLAEVEKQAFEAFNWTGSPAAAAAAGVDPRMQAAARAAAAASSAPPAITGGVGNAALAGKVDLEALAANTSKASAARNVVNEVLGDEA